MIVNESMMTEPNDNADGDGPPTTVEAALPLILDANEARILGCLIEKQATTPDVYPLTLNAIASACNQKTSRDPVMQLEPGEVGHNVRELENKGLIAGTLGARASRYEHRFDAFYNVTARQRALLGLLLLRGPQTINELYARSERISDFPDAAEVRTVLERLREREPAMAVLIPHRAGQREDRYMHLLCGPIDITVIAASDPKISEHVAANDSLSARIDELERHVAQVQTQLVELQARLSGTGS